MYNLNSLVDILTKREYLYREYSLNQGYTVSLPKYFLASPANPLFEEVKASYSWVDPTSFSTEVSRDLMYTELTKTKFTLLTKLSNSLHGLTGVNLSLLTNPFSLYFFDSNLSQNLNLNTDLYKNQYRPLKKGVTNMIRLHATGAIAMPIEMRIHILASSKDVIHS